MIRRVIKIGRWTVEFYFAKRSYDSGIILDRMYDFGAGSDTMKEALELMEDGGYNTGFTFTNPIEHLAIIAIGPTTSGKEFQNTVVHEVHHLAVAIADELGIDLEEETPAYIAGDAAMELADVLCRMGCKACSSKNRNS